MVKAKPDCTGQIFGNLTVIGKGKTIYSCGRYRGLWDLQCDCGNTISLPRGDFDRAKGGQKSCGCRRSRGLIDNKRRPNDITGQKFGALTVIRLTGRKDDNQKPTWYLQCDCGECRELSLSRLSSMQYYGLRINCGSRSNHVERWLTYPATPSPYPADAGELLIKYLPLTELSYNQINQAVEDEKRDRLIRVCWIVAYRRSQGEQISLLKEERIVKKHLRYSSVDVFRRRQLEGYGGLMYDTSDKKRQIGIAMTDGTKLDYPVIETSGTICISSNTHKLKRLKFQRK